MLNLAAVAASVCRVATRAEVLARPQAFFFSRGWLRMRISKFLERGCGRCEGAYRKIDAAVIYDCDAEKSKSIGLMRAP